MNLIKLFLTAVIFSLVGCATQLQQNKMNDVREQFKKGDLNTTLSTIESTFSSKNALYYLELGQTQRLMGARQISSSTKSLLIADQQVERWEIQVKERLKKSLNDVGSYLLSEGLSNEYDLKPYEISLLSQYLSLNHITQGHWGDAMVEAKKMAQREKVIEELVYKKVTAISQAQQKQQSDPKTRGSTNRIEEINGYPVNLLDDDETRNLKNSYQNPSAYYISAFIYESQGETSLAAPGYRLATELRPSVNLFRSGLENLDTNTKNQLLKKDADTLFIIDTGFIPKVSLYKINKTFNFPSGPKVITMSFPIIERSSETFNPSLVQVGDQYLRPEMTSNIDAMARKNLKDDMPGYILRATSRAIVSLAAQEATSRATRRNNNKNDAMVSAFAGLITGIALQAINVTDIRHWTTLPAQTFMARANLPVGSNNLQFATPYGRIQSQTINLVPGYNIIYLRIFRDKASVLTSNDQLSLPVKPLSSENTEDIDYGQSKPTLLNKFKVFFDKKD